MQIILDQFAPFCFNLLGGSRKTVSRQIKLIRETLEVEKDTIVIPFSAETKQGREEIWNLIDEIRSDAEESGE